MMSRATTLTRISSRRLHETISPTKSRPCCALHFLFRAFATPFAESRVAFNRTPQDVLHAHPRAKRFRPPQNCSPCGGRVSCQQPARLSPLALRPSKSCWNVLAYDVPLQIDSHVNFFFFIFPCREAPSSCTPTFARDAPFLREELLEKSPPLSSAISGEYPPYVAFVWRLRLVQNQCPWSRKAHQPRSPKFFFFLTFL